jgi:hypothetical protein
MRVELDAAKRADTFYSSIMNDNVTQNVHLLLCSLNSFWINRKNPKIMKKMASSIIILGSSLYNALLKSPSEVVEAIDSSPDYNDCVGTGGWSVIMKILSHVVNQAMYRQRFIALYMINILYQGVVFASDRLLLLMTSQNNVITEFVSSHISLLITCLSEYPSFYNCWTLPPSGCSLPILIKSDIIRCQHDLLCAVIISRGGVEGLLLRRCATKHSISFNEILQRRMRSAASLSYATILSSIGGGAGGGNDSQQENINVQDSDQESSQYSTIFEDTMHLVKLILDNAVDSICL